MQQNIIFYVLIVVIVLLILVLLYNIFFTSKDNKINDAVKAVGINIIGQENFKDNDIVYDSIDKIMFNFERYLNTYATILNVNDMNEMFKKYTNTNKTLDGIISENININYNDLYQKMILPLCQVIYSITNNDIDNILAGLLFINSLNIKIIESNINYKLYYLDDYNNNKDFVIYLVHNNYDINNLEKEIDTAVEIEKPFELINTLQNNTKLYKYSINKQINISFKYMIRNIQKKAIDNITNEESEQLIQIYKKNSKSLIKYLQLYLLIPFVKLQTNTEITTNKGIGKDLLDLFTDKNSFTDDMKPYLPQTDQIKKLIMFAENIIIKKI
jgi:hypothetical protein